VYKRQAAGSANENAEISYVFELNQAGNRNSWLIAGKDGNFLVYRMHPEGDSHGKALNIGEYDQADVQAVGDVLIFNLPLNAIEYSSPVWYNARTNLSHTSEQGTKMLKSLDSANSGRLGSKKINPLNLFNQLCGGRG